MEIYLLELARNLPAGGREKAVHRELLASVVCRSQALGKLQVLQYPEALCLLPSCLGVSTGARGELLVTGCCWLPCPARTREQKSLVPEKVMQKETAKQTHRNQEGNLFSSSNISSALSPEKASMPAGKGKIPQICSMITEQAERMNFKLRGNKLITSIPKVKREIIRKI